MRFFLYSLLFPSLVSFFAVILIPDAQRQQYLDNLIGWLLMFLAGPYALLTMTVQFSKSFSSIQVKSTVDEIEGDDPEGVSGFSAHLSGGGYEARAGRKGGVPEGFAGT